MNDPAAAHDQFVHEVLNQKLKEGKMGTMYIPEIFDALANYSKTEDKIKVLHANISPSLQIVLRLTIDPDIKFNFSLKEFNALDIKPMDIPDFDTAPVTLLSEAKRLINLTNKKQGVQLSKEKSLKLAKEWASAMHPNDVEVFKQMIAGKFKFKGLTERIILQAFPQLIPQKAETSLPLDEDDDVEDDTTNEPVVTESESDEGSDVQTEKSNIFSEPNSEEGDK